MTLVEPKWGGSLAAMHRVAMHAVLHAMTNPLLVAIATDTSAYAAGYHGCACSDPVDLTAFRNVFDQFGNGDALGSAGTAASAAQRWDYSVVYLAELLRFNPEDENTRVTFINDLAQLGETSIAIAEGNLAVASSPHDEWPYRARGYAYQQAKDFAKAEQDYGTALLLAPADDWIRSELGIIYVYSTQEWDKGWAVSQSLIDTHPEKSSGWVLRFSIQKDQPRPGVRETAKYLVDHFGEDPTAQNAIMDAQQMLAVPPSHP